MTYRHYIQVYLIILHKYSSDSLYWPSLSTKKITKKIRHALGKYERKWGYATLLTYKEKTFYNPGGLEHV